MKIPTPQEARAHQQAYRERLRNLEQSFEAEFQSHSTFSPLPFTFHLSLPVDFDLRTAALRRLAELLQEVEKLGWKATIGALKEVALPEPAPFLAPHYSVEIYVDEAKI